MIDVEFQHFCFSLNKPEFAVGQVVQKYDFQQSENLQHINNIKLQ